MERCAEESKGTERTDTPADQQGLNPTAWTPDEQKLLEQVGTVWSDHLVTWPSNH